MGRALGASAAIRLVTGCKLKISLIFQLEVNNTCMTHALFCDVHVWVCGMCGVDMGMHTCKCVYQLKSGSVSTQSIVQ